MGESTLRVEIENELPLHRRSEAMNDDDDDDDDDEEETPPTRYDVEVAIEKLKTNKSPGTDNIPGELIHMGASKSQKLYIQS